ncbi:MAG TPA: PHP domain-containing protein [Mycobacteriales bacterium]|jgi:predicted metal-dependent phosphoesterase TrpH|nr:PHP domain-containing protein [Mycobacteriales bacterium]
MRVDLHTHSTASDGTTSPAELVRAAAGAGLDVVALTDHDTTSGWSEAAAALPAGLTLVPGAELSCVWSTPDGPIGLHLLAYLFDPAEPVLRAERARVREGRTVRARRIVELMRADGHPVAWEDVLAEAAGGPVGRPHLARALVRHGLVADVAAAFTPEWIGRGGRYRVVKPDSDVCDAIRMVRAAGGVPVVAHPLAAARGVLVPEGSYAEMAAAGLAGLEADHVDHDPAARRRVREIARDLGLFVTGSSDFHGTNKTVALGASTTDPAVYEQLLDQATGAEPVAA